MYAGGYHAQCCHRGLIKPGDTSGDTSYVRAGAAQFIFATYSYKQSSGRSNEPRMWGWEQGHWDTDAAHFAELQIDYLKSDPCTGTGPMTNKTAPYTPAEIFNKYNTEWGAAFRKIGYLDKVFLQGSGPGRALNISGCASCGDASWPELLNSWRTTGDVAPTFGSMMSNIQKNDQYAIRAGPGHWNDADMLQCGQPGMALSECRLALSLWSIAKSSMLIGADVRKFSKDTLTLLKNSEVIAVNQ